MPQEVQESRLSNMGETPTYLVRSGTELLRGRKKEECSHLGSGHSPFTKLLGFPEPTGIRDQFHAIKLPFAVDVPTLFQVIKRAGLGTCLRPVHPFSVAVI